jgi:hypothetical protein
MRNGKIVLRHVLHSLLLGLAACGNGVLGTECPRPIDCVAERDAGTDLIPTEFPSFSSAGQGTFKIVWESDNRCIGACPREGKLLQGANDVAWSLPRSAIPTRIERVDASATRTPHPLPAPPMVEGDLLDARTFGVAGGDGSVLLRAQWDVNGFSGERLAGPDEILKIQPDGSSAHITLAGTAGQLRLPLGTLASQDGFLLYALEGTSNDVRLFNREGAPLWRALLPASASSAAGAAAATDSLYVVGTGTGSGQPLPAYGLTWIDREGQVLRVAVPSSATWRSVHLLPLGGERYALAARSDVATVATSEGTGNLDLVRFGGDEPEQGVRMMRNCYHQLRVLGFATDPEGNMFVSTVAGQNGSPHALLCRAPVSGAPQCFDSPIEGLMLGEIVATSRTTLYAIADTRILRIELP